MKQNKTLWVLWHVLLAIAVAGGFYAFRHHVLNRAIVINSHYMDEGIPLPKLISIVQSIAEQHPDCRVLSVKKNYHVLEIKTAWISEVHKAIHFGFSETDGKWMQQYDIHAPIEGISPADLLAILQITQTKSDNHMDKRVLSVTILDGKVEVMTGVTNHSLGGGGNTMTFQKVGDRWVEISGGYWIS